MQRTGKTDREKKLFPLSPTKIQNIFSSEAIKEHKKC